MRDKIKSIFKDANEIFHCIAFAFKLQFNSSRLLFFAQIIIRSVMAILPIAAIWSFKELINGLVKVAHGNKSDVSYCIFTIVIYIVIKILTQILGELRYFIGLTNEDKVTKYIDNMVINKVINLDLSFFDSPKCNDQYNIIINNRYVINNLVWGCFEIFQGIITIISSVIMLWNFNVILTLSIIICSIPAFLCEDKYRSIVWGWENNSSNNYRKMNYMNELVHSKSHAYELRLYNIGHKMIDKYVESWRIWFKEKNKRALSFNIKNIIFSLLYVLNIIGVFLLSIKKFLVGKISVGDIQFYVNLTDELSYGISSILSNVSSIHGNSYKVKAIMDFVEWEPKYQEEGSSILTQMPKITFENVGFKYPDTEKWILRNLSFTIDSVERVSLVGLNGAGKSTIIKLILRFYDTTEGKILVNDINIKEYSLVELRKKFGVLFQDYNDYAFTLEENITLSDLENNKDEERILRACQMSGVDKIINEFENGLNTPLTRIFEKEGRELSGGQWQKIALARAFFRRADIIILDEPSASLDPEAEHLIFTKFMELCKNKGAILISHRLSNVMMTDRIIIIEDGHVIEEGTHEALMNKNGKYAYLFNLQAEKYMQ